MIQAVKAISNPIQSNEAKLGGSITQNILNDAASQEFSSSLERALEPTRKKVNTQRQPMAAEKRKNADPVTFFMPEVNSPKNFAREEVKENQQSEKRINNRNMRKERNNAQEDTDENKTKNNQKSLKAEFEKISANFDSVDAEFLVHEKSHGNNAALSNSAAAKFPSLQPITNSANRDVTTQLNPLANPDILDNKNALAEKTQVLLDQQNTNIDKFPTIDQNNNQTGEMTELLTNTSQSELNFNQAVSGSTQYTKANLGPAHKLQSINSQYADVTKPEFAEFSKSNSQNETQIMPNNLLKNSKNFLDESRNRQDLSFNGKFGANFESIVEESKNQPNFNGLNYHKESGLNKETYTDQQEPLVNAFQTDAYHLKNKEKESFMPFGIDKLNQKITAETNGLDKQFQNKEYPTQFSSTANQLSPELQPNTTNTNEQSTSNISHAEALKQNNIEKNETKLLLQSNAKYQDAAYSTSSSESPYSIGNFDNSNSPMNNLTKSQQAGSIGNRGFNQTLGQAAATNNIRPDQQFGQQQGNQQGWQGKQETTKHSLSDVALVRANAASAREFDSALNNQVPYSAKNIESSGNIPSLDPLALTEAGQTRGIEPEQNSSKAKESGVTSKLTQATLDRIKDHAEALAAKGSGLAKVQINDSKLGAVNIEVALDSAGKINVEIKASEERVKKELEKSLDSLKEGLESANLSVSSISITKDTGSSANNSNMPTKDQGNNQGQNFFQQNNQNQQNREQQQYLQDAAAGFSQGNRPNTSLQKTRARMQNSAILVDSAQQNRQKNIVRDASGSLKVTA